MRKRELGMIALFVALGMFLMLIIFNRAIGFLMIALLLLVAFVCFRDKCR